MLESHVIHLEEWYSIFRSIGLKLFTVVFLLMLLRAIFMPKKKVDHASALPLEDEKIRQTHANNEQR
jgi:cbb3-type cytochrome oxidase subunit 3